MSNETCWNEDEGKRWDFGSPTTADTEVADLGYEAALPGLQAMYPLSEPTAPATEEARR